MTLLGKKGYNEARDLTKFYKTMICSLKIVIEICKLVIISTFCKKHPQTLMFLQFLKVNQSLYIHLHQLNSLFKRLVTHNDILKIYKIIQYSENIFKCNMGKNIFKIYKKITFLLKKKNFCIMNKIILV